jgi:spore coat protein U-like protein
MRFLKIGSLTLVAALAGGSVALAQGTTATLQVTATVPLTCSSFTAGALAFGNVVQGDNQASSNATWLCSAAPNNISATDNYGLSNGGQCALGGPQNLAYNLYFYAVNNTSYQLKCDGSNQVGLGGYAGAYEPAAPIYGDLNLSNGLPLEGNYIDTVTLTLGF